MSDKKNSRDEIYFFLVESISNAIAAVTKVAMVAPWNLPFFFPFFKPSKKPLPHCFLLMTVKVMNIY